MLNQSRIFCLAAMAALVALVGRPASTQDTPKQPSPQEDRLLRDQERVHQLVKKLEDKIYQMRDQLEKKGDHEAVNRLDKALFTLREKNLNDMVGALTDELKKANYDNVRSRADDVLKIIEEILAILEKNLDDKKREEEIKKLEEHLRNLDDIINKEKEIKKALDQVNRDSKEYKQMAEMLDRFIEAQKAIMEMSNLDSLRQMEKDLDDRLKELDKVMEAQKQSMKEARDAKSPELQSLGDMLKDLGDLMRDQDNLNRATEATGTKLSSLDRILKDMEDSIQQQKRLKEQTDQADKDREGDLPKLEREQKALSDKLWNLGNELYKLPGLEWEKKQKALNELEKGHNELDNAAKNLAARDPGTSSRHQQQALDNFEKALKEMKEMRDGVMKDKASELGRLADTQKKASEKADQLRDSMGKASEQSTPQGKNNLDNAKKAMGKASGAMSQAKDKISKGQTEGAGKSQQESMDNMKAARDELESLSNALGQKQKDSLGKAAEGQKGVEPQARDLAKKVGESASKEDLQKQSPDANQAMREAQQAMRSAADSMSRAAQGMQSGSPSEGDKGQQQAMQNLQRAREKLQEAKKGMEGQRRETEDNLGKLGDTQKGLEEALKEKVTKWLEKKAEEKAKENPDEANKLKEASKDTGSAGQNMDQASKSMKEQAPTDAMKNEKKALEDLEKAREKLGDLAKQPPRDKDKDKARDQAPKQEGVKELTKELQKKLEQDNKKGASESAGSAQQNMEQAQKHMMKGGPPQAEEDVDKALRDLDDARQQLQRELEDLKRQQREETLAHLAEELGRIKEAEIQIRTETGGLDERKKANGALSRGEIGKADRLGVDQIALMKRMEEIKKKLGMENVDVYVYVVESIMEDMDEVSKALREAEVGQSVQNAESDIIAKLTDLIEAWKTPKGEPKPPPPPGGGGGGGGGKPPLVPDVVQLNLMRRIQQRILDRTQGFNKQLDKGAQDLSPFEKRMGGRLAEEERKLGDILKQFIEKFQKEAEEYEKEGR